MPKMPTLGPQPKSMGPGKVAMILVVFAACAGGYAWWTQHKAGLTTAQPVHAEAPAPMPVPVPSPVAPTLAAAPTPPPVAPSPTAPAPVAIPIAAAPGLAPLPSIAAAPKAAGPRHISVTVDGPLETAIIQATSHEVGPALAQVVTRALVWWMTIPGDLRRNDTLDVIYEERGNEEPQVDAVRLTSGKFNKTFQAYRFKADGDSFSRYYMPSGEELELRLRTSPLDSYEQITSLIRDGRHHKGVDFKTPVGSKVKTTFAGTITKKNWNWHGNGNCLEVAEGTAPFRKAMFLHLSELPKSLTPGKKVARGDIIADSGNTGHSFAPHLHYQLMSADDRVLDPFESQESWRRALPASAKPALDAQVAKWEALMAPAAIATTGTP